MRILFKTKGGHQQGLGDVTSSLALAEEFKSRRHTVSFLINNDNTVAELVSEKGFEYKICDSSDDLAKCIHGQLVDVSILNQLNTPETEAVFFKENSKMLVTIDDTGDAAKLADLCFNVLYPAPLQRCGVYPIEHAYSDFAYIALSADFTQKRNISKVIKEKVETILVTQGGSDTYGFTPKIMRALYEIPVETNIKVVIGPAFRHQLELADILHQAPRKFDIIRRPQRLSDLMLHAELAISAGGNTLFELACLGVPTVVVCGEIFETGTADRMAKEGFGLNLGFGENLQEQDIFAAVKRLLADFSLRLKMSWAGPALVDGQGVKRIVELVNNRYLILNHAYNIKEPN